MGLGLNPSRLLMSLGTIGKSPTPPNLNFLICTMRIMK